VTHDRYLVQKIATHMIYIEKGIAHVFDRLSAFEEWLGEGDRKKPQEAQEAQNHVPFVVSSPLSKNRREQLEKEVAQLEQKIAKVEGELAELELSFQNPATGTDWESTHKRYADLKVILERLYEDLTSRWELMG
jgi:ATPase subunit of ABC transporter with duplicated ATPase domains